MSYKKLLAVALATITLHTATNATSITTSSRLKPWFGTASLTASALTTVAGIYYDKNLLTGLGLGWGAGTLLSMNKEKLQKRSISNRRAVAGTIAGLTGTAALISASRTQDNMRAPEWTHTALGNLSELIGKKTSVYQAANISMKIYATLATLLTALPASVLAYKVHDRIMQPEEIQS